MYEPNRIARTIREELEPFFFSFAMLGARNEKFQQFKRNYQSFKARYRNAKQKEEFVTDGIAEYWNDPEEYTNSAKFVFLVMFGYLGLVETVATCVVDILVMFLIANGHDFHVESKYGPSIKHATSISSIMSERVQLSTKLHFLREHGITFFADIVDNKLRNDIAHLNFQLIGPDDYVAFSITDKKTGKREVLPARLVLINSIGNLITGLECVVNLLSTELDERLC